MDAGSPMIRLDGVRFDYGPGSFGLEVGQCEIGRHQHVACIGPSGTGKTTLAHLIVGILTPLEGRVWIGDVALSELSESERRAQRISRIGMVFQDLELLEYLSALDNILLPYHVTDRLRLSDEVRARAHRLAEEAGIAHALWRSPKRLSQGERQRVAICRALVTEPELVICDEPTGNLDPDTARVILDLLFAQSKAHAEALLMVTHDHSILDRFDAVIDVRRLGGPGAGVVS